MDEMSIQLDDGTDFGETFFLLATVHRKHKNKKIKKLKVSKKN